MLLGVSRQAISKWESEKAYPEMDKLLMICDLFGCTLDDLVLGDVSRPAASASTAGSSNVDSSAETASPLAASSKTAGIIAPIAELAQDITGYDEHRRRFALLIAGGVAAIVAGVGIGNLFDSSNSILGATPLNDFLTFLCVCVGVIAGLAMLIPGGLSRIDFKRRHPYVEDFYTGEDRSRELRLLVIGIVGGISAILIGIAVTVYADDVLGVSDGWPNAIFSAALCAQCFRVCLLRHEIQSAQYQRIQQSGRGRPQGACGRAGFLRQTDRRGVRHHYADSHGDWLVPAVFEPCGIARRLVGRRVERRDGAMFWLPWPIGGVLCGVAAVAIQLIKDYRERK